MNKRDEALKALNMAIEKFGDWFDEIPVDSETDEYDELASWYNILYDLRRDINIYLNEENNEPKIL